MTNDDRLSGHGSSVIGYHRCIPCRACYIRRAISSVYVEYMIKIVETTNKLITSYNDKY